MERIAKFEKISFEQFRKDWIKTFADEEMYEDGTLKAYVEDNIRKVYDEIKLPQRATIGSAGYDMYLPYNAKISIGTSLKFPTGIRCKIDEGWVLKIYPRSGHGFKYGIHLANTTGIIDSDYYYSNNEGHIFVKIVNDCILSQNVEIKQNEAFCQGIFVPFGITVDDYTTGIRNGGMGSTSQKKTVND